MSDEDIVDLLGKIAKRSPCRVKMGAVIISDDGKLVEVGWNNPGEDGKGECAERNAIRRAIRRGKAKYLNNATVHIFGLWKNTGRVVRTPFPCERCEAYLREVGVREIIAHGKILQSVGL